MQSQGLSMTPVSIKPLSQKVLKKTELDGSLKTLVQSWHEWHHRTWRSHESCVCKSQRRGRNIPSYNNRDSKAQKEDWQLKIYYKKDVLTSNKDISFKIINDTQALCKNDKLIIPTSLQHRALSWYHHYLQHPGHSCLKEMIRSMMYRKGMCNTIQKCIKSCRSCQINKRHSQKYGHVPSKLIITTPWKALCVNLIGPYTLTGKDGSSIDFMCLKMFDPATSWFEIVELLSVDKQLSPHRASVQR